MKKYTFSDISSFSNPIKIIFLCGSKYIKEKENKRIVLKKYLEEKNKKNKVLILEENFTFRKKDRDLFSYGQIGLKNLHDVEKLTALLADKIFIIHESFSTAAEIGVFSTNENLYDKICIMAPDKYNFQEDVISAFLKLGFWKNEKPLLKPVIRFLFKPEIQIISEDKNVTLTSFIKNKKNDIMADKIDKFIDIEEGSINLSISKNKFKKSKNASIYEIDSSKKKL